MRVYSARRVGWTPTPSDSHVRCEGGYARGGGSSGSRVGPRGAVAERAAMRAVVVTNVAAEPALAASAGPHDIAPAQPVGASGEWQGA